MSSSPPPSSLDKRFKIRVFAWYLIFLNENPTEVDQIISKKNKYTELQQYMRENFNGYDIKPMINYMIAKAKQDHVTLTEEDTTFEMNRLSLGFLEALELAAEMYKELQQTVNAPAGGSLKKPTKEKVLLPGKSKPNTVYLGTRGGKYLKVNGKFVSLSKFK